MQVKTSDLKKVKQGGENSSPNKVGYSNKICRNLDYNFISASAPGLKYSLVGWLHIGKPHTSTVILLLMMCRFALIAARPP